MRGVVGKRAGKMRLVVLPPFLLLENFCPAALMTSFAPDNITAHGSMDNM
jgi:hypothetical protein